MQNLNSNQVLPISMPFPINSVPHSHVWWRVCCSNDSQNIGKSVWCHLTLDTPEFLVFFSLSSSFFLFSPLELLSFPGQDLSFVCGQDILCLHPDKLHTSCNTSNSWGYRLLGVIFPTINFDHFQTYTKVETYGTKHTHIKLPSLKYFLMTCSIWKGLRSSGN